MTYDQVTFGSLFEGPVRNGLTRPTSVRGVGYRMVNMGEIFAYDRIANQEMERVQLNDRELEVATLSEGDLLFARSSLKVEGTGKCSLVQRLEEVTTFESHLIRARLNRSKADPRFFFYFFQSYIGRSTVLSIVKQVGAAGLAGSQLQNLRVPHPPLAVQSRISDVLSNYDDLIENNRRRMVLLEESAQFLYQEWFVRHRFPGHECSNIVRGIPKGWRRALLGEFVTSQQVSVQTGPFGTQLKASEYTESGIPLINVRNIGYGNLRPEKLEFVPENVADRLSVHVLKTGDIVFGRKGAVDRHLFISPAEDGWIQGSDCIRIRALSDGLCMFLLSFAFRESSHREWMLIQCGNKATMASLNQEVIGRIPVILPPKNLLREFQSFATDVLRQIAVLSRQNLKLRAARDLLLPRLMSGELVV